MIRPRRTKGSDVRSGVEVREVLSPNDCARVVCGIQGREKEDEARVGESGGARSAREYVEASPPTS